ncbi:transposase [Escherichia coli]|nr:transposase [Escherichia coli]
MLRATKIRIYPTPEQAAFLNAQFGAVRFAYNKALHIKKHAYQRHGVNLSPRKDLKPLLSVAKKSRRYAWLKEFDSMALQQAVINLDVAFSNFFNPKLKARFPTFKRKHGKQSSYHCVGIKVQDNAIKIPKLAPIEARLHRELHGKLKSITVTRSATGKYYASILCDDGASAPEKPTYLKEEKITGLDMGLEHYAITSDAVKVPNPRHLINAGRNLRRKQKALSRKQKGSANRKKARIRLAALHEPTKGVHLVKLDQWFASSKTCHCCGYKMPEMPLHKRIWRCHECGAEHDRDINAALNIRQKGILELKAAGLVVSAHGGQRKSVAQTVAA